MGKAAIYNPYLDTLGGGEKYTMAFANVLAELGYTVYVEWKNVEIKSKIEKRFGIKLHENISFITSINRGEGYDLCFWVSDGSIPTLRSRNNIIHFQVPFTGVGGNSLLNKMKLFRVNKVVCNSIFTKRVIDKEYGVDSEVVYPPIDTKIFKPKRKENIILYVGRFSNLLQSKGQDILVDEFKKLYSNKFSNWKLVLAGGVEVGADKNVKQLKKMVGKYPIEIIESPSFSEIKNLYGKAKLFWSASGFGSNETKNPEKVEHFGMTLVEAMSAGCVPVVYNAGGHKEIIESSINGYLWQNKRELVSFTKKLIGGKGLIKEMSVKAIGSSLKYDNEIFKQKIVKLLN